MKSEDLDALQALAEKATPGPWFVKDWQQDDGDNPTTIELREPEILHPGQSSIWPGGIACRRIAETEEGESPIADAAYIAAANPQTILSLIARIRELGGDTGKAWQPKFEAIAHDQEQLSIQFCAEIARSRPDPVRLIEMAEALYLAERNDPVIGAHSAAAPEGGKP